MKHRDKSKQMNRTSLNCAALSSLNMCKWSPWRETMGGKMNIKKEELNLVRDFNRSYRRISNKYTDRFRRQYVLYLLGLLEENT